MYLTIGRDLFNSNNGNVWSHIALTFAIVEHGTLAIDAYVDHTEDWARLGEHYYSNKAPGVALATVPVYWAQFKLQGWLGVPPDDPRARNIAVYLANVFTSILPTLIALGLLFRALKGRFALTERQALGVIAAWATGSLGFVYAVILFGHQSSAALLAIGIAVSLEEEKASVWRLFLAGVAISGAVTCDYFAGMGAAAWTAWIGLTHRSHPRRWALWSAYILGGIAPAIVLGAYHYACFGSVFSTAYAHINPMFEDVNSLGSVSLRRLANITILPFRGFFYSAPVWLLAFFSVRPLIKERPLELIAAAASFVGAFIYLAALPSAYGGFCIGPRYVTPLLPLFALLLVPAARTAPRLFAALLAASTALLLTGVLTEPLPPASIGNPFSRFFIPIMVGNLQKSPQWSIFRWMGMSFVQSWMIYMAIWGSGSLYLVRNTGVRAPAKSGKRKRGA
jgi:hypothetical protein